MSDDDNAIKLALHIDAGSQADQEYLDRLTRQLLAELRELDVETVELVGGGVAPDGAKSAEAALLGDLAVAVVPVVMASLIGFLQSWLGRGRSQSAKIKIQNGDRSIELEYRPGAMSIADLKELTDILMPSTPGK